MFNNITKTKRSYIVAEPDMKTTLGLKLTSLLQTCTYKNCRTWYDKTSTSYRNCSSCWTKEDLNKGGVFHDNWIAKDKYPKENLEYVDPNAPFTLSSITLVPYTYCKSYDASGICDCWPDYLKPLVTRNECRTEIETTNPKFKNCVETGENEELEKVCKLCKPGYFLELDGSCTCDNLTTHETGQCNNDHCFAAFKGCRHCNRSPCTSASCKVLRRACTICSEVYATCKIQNTDLQPMIANCKYHKIPSGCYQCNIGYILDAQGTSCTE